MAQNFMIEQVKCEANKSKLHLQCPTFISVNLVFVHFSPLTVAS